MAYTNDDMEKYCHIIDYYNKHIADENDVVSYDLYQNEWQFKIKKNFTKMVDYFSNLPEKEIRKLTDFLGIKEINTAIIDFQDWLEDGSQEENVDYISICFYPE